MTTRRLRQPLWLVPLAIAALVAVFGWWGNLRLRQTVEQQLKAQLNATLNANVTALEIWMADQKKLAATLAEEQRVRVLATNVLEKFNPQGPPSGPVRPPPDVTEIEELANYLRPRVNTAGYELAELVNTNFFVVATSGPRGFGAGRPVSDSLTNKYAELFETKKPVLITPYKPEFFRPPPRGRRGRSGEPPRGQNPGEPRGPNPGDARGPGPGEGPRQRGPGGGLRGGRGEGFLAARLSGTLMQVAAPVRDVKGVVRAALALAINPETEFSRILSVAQRGESGETYAFDQTGLMISRSRFDAELKKQGLLAASNSSSALNLRLIDPKAETVDGVQPLTRIVADAVAQEDGIDVEPSRDYRGVQVVGAWRWLKDQGFGVATQIDASEAYESLRVLKTIFILLCLLLLLSASGMFVFSYSNFTWRRRLTEAELKLKQLGQYALEEKIGEGGMGVVYRARHALLRRDTAVKLLMPDRADSLAIQRFEREVVLSCQLTHPNTIQVYDYGHTPDGIFYYAMEFLRGLNLHELIARYGPQPEGRVVHILAQVCDSLNEAHSMGLVHRDIKPANVFLTNRGGVPDGVKVLDFGLVRQYGDANRELAQTVSGKGLEGTPWFMPPESIKDSSKSDPRSDIYSVAALGYYLLTGEFVFDGETLAELCAKHLSDAPTPASQRTTNPISAELDAIILKCLEKDPDKRPQTARELRDLLLATPRVGDWSPEARATWWSQYQSAAVPKPGETGHAVSTPPQVTVSIDLEDRV
jgi:serine/threonine protein kinase